MKPGMTGLAGLLVCATVTTGCAGALLVSGASALPTAMMAVSAMDSIGLLSRLEAAFPRTAEETNPALRENPDLSDRGLSRQQAALNARLETFADNAEARLATVDAVDCALTERGRWLLARTSSRTEYEAMVSSLPEGIRPQVTNVDASVLQGECVDGLPNGDFVSVGRFETVQNVSGNRLSTTERQRLEGTMTDAGTLDGTVRREAVSQTTGSTSGVLSRSYTVADWQFDNGNSRDLLSISRTLDSDGSVSQIVTVVVEPAAQGLQRQLSWAGSMLASEVTLRNGQMHGWMTSYPVTYVPGVDPGEATRTCYRSGQQAPDAACQGMPGA